MSIAKFLNTISKHECKMQSSFCMIPSENILSPLARLSMITDCYSRYSFNNSERSFLNWYNQAFPGGKFITQIEAEILIPILKELTCAPFINCKANSGTEAILIILATYLDFHLDKTKPLVFTLSPDMGGHGTTGNIANLMGYKEQYIPINPDNPIEIDWDKFKDLLVKYHPLLIYLDHSTLISPLDYRKIVEYKNMYSESTYIHADTSQVMALLMGGAFINPLAVGVNSCGGSMHKTFPGPHKGIIFSNSYDIIQAVGKSADIIISHSHAGDVMALTMSCIEFLECDGRDYAYQIIKNAKTFGRAMNSIGFGVSGGEIDYTATHQIWLDTASIIEADQFSKLLYKIGIIVNLFPKLPLIPNKSFRLGFSELTKIGMKENDIIQLADYFDRLAIDRENLKQLEKEITDFRQKFKIEYCFKFFEEEVTVLLDRYFRIVQN